jgi:hypothetical protein
MMMMKTEVRTVERVVNQATMLVSQQSILLGHRTTLFQILGEFPDTAATNHWQTRRAGWRMTWWTTSLIHMSRPCATKQLPLILFSMYSVTVKTQHYRGQGMLPALPLILCWLLFLFQFIFPRGKDICSCFAVSIVCLIFIVSMTGIVRHQELVVWMSLHRVLSLN